MFKCFYLVLFIWALVISSVHAKTYIRDYTYKASEADSKITSRTNALDQVKLILLQEIGTYIRQEINITKDGEGNSYKSEDVEAITAGLTKVEIIEEKWDGETYYLKAKIDADTTRVLNELKKSKNYKSKEKEDQLAALKDMQRKLKESREKITKLRSKLAQVNGSEKESLAVQYTDSVEEILLSEMAVKGYTFSQQGQFENAAFWYRKAANKGYANAQYNLGVLYSKGRGVEKNYKQAAAWYLKAANQGYTNAQFNLGVIYSKGQGVEQSNQQSAAWYHKAAENGDVYSQYNLGDMYFIGQGVEQSYQKSAAWYRKAAEQGDAYSQYKLGLMYEFNWGVKRNKKTAEEWYKKSCISGYSKACSYP